MADNTLLDAGTGGDTVVTREISHGGDTAKLQGVFAMGISGTEGAYTAAAINGDATNGLDVDVTRVGGTVTVDGSGVTQPVSHAALTELAAAINASSQVDVNIAAAGAAVPVTDNSGSLTVDNAALSVTGGGAEATALRVTIASDSTGVVSVDDNGGALTVDGTVTANLAAGTNNIGDVDVLSIAAGDNNIGNVDIASIAAGDNNIGNVDVVTLPNVTLAAGTNTNEIVGDAADDAAAAGNPVLIGGVAVEMDGTDPTTVSAEGDAARLRTDRARRLLVSEHHPRSFFTSADYGAAQTNTSVQAAPGAGLSLYITDIVISNGATAGNITLLDGSGGTVKFECYPAINGGVAISLRQPIRLTANTALVITSTTVTTHSVNIGGYTAP